MLTDGHLDDKVAARLGRAGADRVLCCEGAGLGGPPLDATHGHALHAAVERIPPLVVMFPAGGAGPELGPALAARLGAAFAASADLELGEAATPLADGIGRIFLRRWRRDRTSYRRLDPVELERPVVAILSAGAPADIGTESVEVDIIACPQPAKGGVVEIASEDDDTAAAALASTLIVVDPALDKDILAALVAAAPPGVAVVDAVAAATTLAVAVPRILISATSGAVAAMVTPRGRVGVVLEADASLPPRTFADVLLRADGKHPTAALWNDIAARLAALALPPVTAAKGTS